MKIVLLGPPGSGKIDIAKLITDTFGYATIHVARELAAMAAETNYLDSLAIEPMLAGRMGEDMLMTLLEDRFQQDDLGDGFIVIDFPRDCRQAADLDRLLERLRRPIDLVLMIDVDPDELMERLVGRIVCDSCEARYNLYINPPLVEGVCDSCGARVKVRPEDYEESIANKIRVYGGQVVPLLNFYHLQGKLRRVNGDSGNMQQLWQEIRHIIEATPPTIIEAAPVVEDAVPIDPVKELIESIKKSATKKKKVARKKATGKKKASVKKKPVVEKKVAPQKKAAKKKAPVTKKAISKKKVVKKLAAKKKLVTKKKSAVKKQVVAKKSVVRKKPVANKIVAKKKVIAKKKPVAKKKTAVKKKPVAKKKATVKKKIAAKKKVTKKRSRK